MSKQNKADKRSKSLVFSFQSVMATIQITVRRQVHSASEIKQKEAYVWHVACGGRSKHHRHCHTLACPRAIPSMISVIAGYAEARGTSIPLMAVRAFLEAFQSSLLDRKAANDLLITYLMAEAVVLTAWEKILVCWLC